MDIRPRRIPVLLMIAFVIPWPARRRGRRHGVGSSTLRSGVRGDGDRHSSHRGPHRHVESQRDDVQADERAARPRSLGRHVPRDERTCHVHEHRHGRLPLHEDGGASRWVAFPGMRRPSRSCKTCAGAVTRTRLGRPSRASSGDVTQECGDDTDPYTTQSVVTRAGGHLADDRHRRTPRARPPNRRDHVDALRPRRPEVDVELAPHQ